MPEEKEVILDLSKVIKFSDTVYISLGTFILSLIIVVLQFIILLGENQWIFDPYILTVFLNFLFMIRGKYPEERVIPDN